MGFIRMRDYDDIEWEIDCESPEIDDDWFGVDCGFEWDDEDY